MLYRLLTFLVFAIAVIALGEWDAKNKRFQFTESANQWWVDFCVGNARDKIKDPAVTFVGVGDDYEPVLEGDSLSRLDYVVLLGNIEHFKPRAVSVAPVITFEQESVLNQGALKKQVLKMPRLTLGSIAESGGAPNGAAETTDFPVIASFEGDSGAVPEITRAVSIPDDEPRANGVAAFTEIELRDPSPDDPAGLPLIGRVGDTIVASFALQSLVADADLTIEDVSVSLPPATDEPVIRVGERFEIPVDAGGLLGSYPHSGVDRELYPVVNARHLPLATSDDPEVAARRSELGDDFESLGRNLVVVGDTSNSARSVELHRGESYAIHELIARSIALVQSGRYIKQWPTWAKYLGIALIVLLALFLFRLPRLAVLFWGFVAAFLYVFGVCLGSFKEWLVWTPPFVPLALFAGILLIGLILPSNAEAKSTSDDADAGSDSKDASGNGDAEATPAN